MTFVNESRQAKAQVGRAGWNVGRNAAALARRFAWTATVISAAAFFFCLGLFFRILVGPVSLGPFAQELHGALNDALPDFDVRFDSAALEWERSEGRVDLVILGTRVFDRGRHIIAQAPKAEIGLAIGPLLRGHIRIDRIALVGVQLTLVHTRSGALQLGFGAGKDREDVLQRIRESLSRSHGSGPPLKSFAVRGARLAFYDEAMGAFVIAPEADLQIGAPDHSARQNDGLEANLAARFEIAGQSARLYATIRIPERGDEVRGDFSVAGLDLKALSRDGHSLAFLAPFALTADISGSWILQHGNTLRFADFGIGATGSIEGFGHPVKVKSLRFVGRYDGASGRFLIDDATIAGEQGRAHLTGSADLKFTAQGKLAKTAFAFAVDRMALDLPGAMEHTVALGHVNLSGSYDPLTRDIELNQADISGGPLSAELSGRIGLFPKLTPELDFDGKVDSIGVRDLLAYWPIHIAGGARAWISENVGSGRMGPVLVHLRIPPGAFQRAALPENAVSVSFPLVDGTITYLRGLTPLTRVVGTVQLTGDEFRATLSSATAGPLNVSNGHVAIDALHMHGTPAVITAHVTGGLPQLLTLLDMKPLQYPTRFHVNTASTRGNTSLDVFFRVPTIKGESVDAIGISVKGTVNNLALSLGPHTRISNGQLSLAVDNSSLRAYGTVDIGSASLGVDWTEMFKPSGPESTKVAVHGVVDEAALTQFGLPGRGFLTGPVGLAADLEGWRGKIRSASIDLDLTKSTLTADLLGWTKPADMASSSHIDARFDVDGNPSSADFHLVGADFGVQGNVTFTPDGSIETLSVPKLYAGADDDFGLTVRKRLAGGLDLVLSGRSLDARGLLKRRSQEASKSNASQKPPEPFDLKLRLDRLVLREGVALAPFALDGSGSGERPTTFSAMGGMSGAAPLKVRLFEQGAQRHIAGSAGDAGAMIRGLFGYSSVKGGTLDFQAILPAASATSSKTGASTGIAGEVDVHNCTILNQPFLARLFSSGSPGGFVDLMRGQGISLDSVRIPFRISDNVITIHDARASGPSVGVTADGYVDRATNQVALQGAVAPLFGINGLLGAIPVLGDVFVSKKGEGIIGITYTMEGSLDEPKLSTNPLSVLAPGIFRRIFEGEAPRAPAAAPAQHGK